MASRIQPSADAGPLPRSPERRSFKPPGWPVGELAPIDVDALSPKELNKAMVRGIMQTHACLEEHITKTRQAQLEAIDKRQMMQDELLGLREDVLEISHALGVKTPEAGAPAVKAKIGLPLIDYLKVAGAAGGSIVGLAALWQLIVAIWPALNAYMLSLHP